MYFILLLSLPVILLILPGLIIGSIISHIGKQRIITFLTLSLLIGIALAGTVELGFLAFCHGGMYGCRKDLFGFGSFFIFFPIFSISTLLSMYLGAFFKSLFRKKVNS